MALFGSPKPVVLKEGSAAEEQLRQMEDAKGTLSPRAEARLEKDLRLGPRTERSFGVFHLA